MLSKIHLDIVDNIKKTYPFLKVVLEHKMPRTILRLDIYLPDISLAIEIQGIQHYEMNSFFHKDSSSFLEANLRDKEKKAIAANNNIDILYIKYNQKKYLDIVFSKINSRILEMEEDDIMFINSTRYSFEDIEKLICPMCKNRFDFKNAVHGTFGKILFDECCGRRFILIEEGDQYFSTTEKIL